MKKFHFHLETVLTYRGHLEEKEKQLLASMRLFYEHERRRLSDIEAQHARVQAERMTRASTQFHKVEIEWYCAYLRRLTALIQSKRTQLAALQTHMDKQKQAVVQAYKNRRILELLKAKEWEEYRRAYNKEEQKIVDELQIAKHPERRSEE